jgi:hypothetical protein
MVMVFLPKVALLVQHAVRWEGLRHETQACPRKSTSVFKDSKGQARHQRNISCTKPSPLNQAPAKASAKRKPHHGLQHPRRRLPAEFRHCGAPASELLRRSPPHHHIRKFPLRATSSRGDPAPIQDLPPIREVFRPASSVPNNEFQDLPSRQHMRGTGRPMRNNQRAFRSTRQPDVSIFQRDVLRQRAKSIGANVTALGARTNNARRITHHIGKTSPIPFAACGCCIC